MAKTARNHTRGIMQISALVKAVAFVMWADEKIDEEEMVIAEGIFKKYKFEWNEAKPLLENQIELMLDESSEDNEEYEDVLDLGVIDFGTNVDRYEVLFELADLVLADKVIDYREIDVMHCIARAINAAPETVTAAILTAALKSGQPFKLNT
jgi:hypothetical protein